MESGDYVATTLRILTVALVAATAMIATAQRQVTTPAVYLGAAWYPEQWNEATWEHDLKLMEEAHFTVVRVGEFAWSRSRWRRMRSALSAMGVSGFLISWATR